MPVSTLIALGFSLPQPSFTIGHSGYLTSSNGNKSGGGVSVGGHYPPNHPLSNSKHLCSICGDRASGKHYGVYSCEGLIKVKFITIYNSLINSSSFVTGCKGFFKRTVRKDLTYACREDRQCLIDKRQRNRCQYCRYQKCLQMGMKREAVQEERQRNKEKGEMDAMDASNGGGQGEMPIERVLEAEKRVECKDEPQVNTDGAAMANICQATDKQLFQLVEWAKHIPHFTELPLDDQVVLLRAGWNELLIAAFSHRSVGVKEGIVLATGLVIQR